MPLLVGFFSPDFPTVFGIMSSFYSILDILHVIIWDFKVYKSSVFSRDLPYFCVQVLEYFFWTVSNDNLVSRTLTMFLVCFVCVSFGSRSEKQGDFLLYFSFKTFQCVHSSYFQM